MEKQSEHQDVPGHRLSYASGNDAKNTDRTDEPAGVCVHPTLLPRRPDNVYLLPGESSVTGSIPLERPAWTSERPTPARSRSPRR